MIPKKAWLVIITAIITLFTLLALSTVDENNIFNRGFYKLFDSQKTKAQECEELGGRLVGCNTVAGVICSVPTTDAGKPCSSSSDCEEECVAPENCPEGQATTEGKCATRTNLACDSVQTVEEGLCAGTYAA